jgi:hypothetical protein
MAIFPFTITMTPQMNKKKYRVAYESLAPASPMWIVCSEFKKILFGRAERSLDYRLRFDVLRRLFVIWVRRPSIRP